MPYTRGVGLLLGAVVLGFTCLFAQESEAARSTIVEKTDSQSIEQRLDTLEAQQNELLLKSPDEIGNVRTFLRDKIALGGFFETGINYLYGPDTPTQLSANTFLFGLNIAGDISDEFRFVGQLVNILALPLLNTHGDPRSTSEQRQFSTTAAFATIALQAYIQYSSNPGFILQTGLGYVPFGFAFQQREPVLFKRRGGPQLISSPISPILWEGIHISGSFPLSTDRIGYNFYTYIPSAGPITTGSNSRNLGAGARLWYSFSDKVTFGLSGQAGRTLQDTSESIGTDINLRVDRFGVVAEYARNYFASGTPGPISYYIEPYVSLLDGKIILYLAADYLDSPNNRTTTSAVTTAADPICLWKYGGGINWLPHPYTRFRLGYLTNSYVGDTALSPLGQNSEYSTFDLSASIAF